MYEITAVRLGSRQFDNIGAAVDALQTEMQQAMQSATIESGVAMEMFMTRVQSNLLERHGSNWPLSSNVWGSDPQRLAMRSGRGLDSVFKSIKVSINNGRNGSWLVQGQVSTGKLSIHETGGTLRPETGKYMALPLRAALSPSGVPLKSGPRQWDNTFVRRTRNGNLIIFRKDRGTVVPLYLLSQSVTIPPRLRLAETIDANLSYFQNKTLQAFEREFIG